MRVKIIRNTKPYRAGEVLVIDSVLAYKLIEQGVAIASTDLTPEDYKIKGQNAGNH